MGGSVAEIGDLGALSWRSSTVGSGGRSGHLHELCVAATWQSALIVIILTDLPGHLVTRVLQPGRSRAAAFFGGVDSGYQVGRITESG